jgi:PAS domain S-box-containing protein
VPDAVHSAGALPFRTLARLGQAVGGSLDPDQVLTAIVQGVLELEPGAVARIWIIEGDVVRLGAEAGSRVPEPRGDKRLFPLGRGLAGTAAVAAAPVIVEDVRADPRVVNRAWIEAEGFVSFLGLPLSARGRRVGVLSLFLREPRRPSPEEIEILQAFGDLAAIAIENARLHASTEQRARRLAALTRVNQLVCSTLDPDRVLEEIARAAAELMAAPLALFWRADADGRRLELVAATDPDRAADFPFRAVAQDQGIIGWIATHRRPANVPDVLADPRFVAGDWWRRHGLRSFYGLPVTDGGQLVAVLALNGREPFRVDHDDEKLLQSFVDQAVVAIRNARLYAASERRRREAEEVARLARTLTETLDPATVADRIVQSLVAFFDVEVAALRLLAPDGSLVALAVAGAGADLLPAGHVFPPGVGLVGRVVRERRALRIDDNLSDPDIHLTPEWRARLAHFGPQAVAAAPLRVNGSLVGVLSIADGHRGVSDADLDLLQTFADHAAVALQNARLYDESERRRRGAEAVLDAARAITSSLELPQILETVTRRTAQAVNADRCSISLLRDGVLVPLLSQPADGSAAPPSGGEERPAIRPESIPAYAQAVAERRPVAVEDTRAGAVPAAWAAELGIASMLVVPLFHQDRLVGVLHLDRRSPSLWSPEHQELAQAIAAQTALAIENARLFAAHREAAEVATALWRLARTLEGVHRLGPMLQRLADTARELLELERSVVFLADAGRLLPAAAAGVRPEHRAAFASGRALEVPALVEALAGGEPILIEDARRDPRVPAGLAERLDLCAVLAIPLISDGRLLGLIAADTPGRATAFTRRQLALARGIGGHAGSAVERALLYRETERRRREAEIFADVARIINGSLDVDTVLRHVVAAARALCHSDGAIIALREPGSATVVCRYSIGYAEEVVQRVEFGKGAGGLVLATGRPFRTPDYVADPRISDDYVEAVRRRGIVAELVVPIEIGGRTEGLIYVDNFSARPFTDRDEAVLTRLATHAAIAIRNSQLFAAEQAARARLAESERFLQSTLDALAELVAVLDEHGTIISVNEAWRRFAAANGLAAPDGGLGLNYLAVCEAVTGEGSEQAREVAAVLREVIAGQRTGAVLEYTCREAGERRWFILRASRFAGPGPVRVVVSHADITSRRLAEEAAREHEAQVRHLQKMEAVGQLAGGLAHDFNNLLTVINGRSQLLLRRLRPEDPLRRDVALIQSTAERAAALTRQLLAFSRKQVLQPRVVDLNEVVRGLVPMLQRLLGEDIELAVAASDPATVKADPSHLEQVIVNLAVNARDAMPRGGRLTMAISRTELDPAFCERHGGGRPGPHAVLTVSDTGHGMSEEVRARAFEPFFTTKPAGRGTGLGLSTVYGIVRQHGGAVTVESEVGRGSTFRVYLPLTDERHDPASDDAAALPTSGAETILLVEDEHDVRTLARDLLRQQGYTVLEAATPAEALEIGERHRDPIHLLLTDVVMPRMSGREVAERLRALRPELRVLYVSGYPDDVLAPHDLDGAERVLLSKPFTPEALMRAVRRVLDAAPQPTA